MNLNKIIVLIIARNLFVCGNNKTASVGNFTLKQFLGVWFEIGRILIGHNPDDENVMKCSRFNVTVENEWDQSFNEVYEFEVAGKIKQVTAHEKIKYSKVYIKFSAVDNYQSIYNIIEYENGEKLIFYGGNGPTFYGMVSRRPIFSSETRAEFEKIADHAGAVTSYLSHNNCLHNY